MAAAGGGRRASSGAPCQVALPGSGRGLEQLCPTPAWTGQEVASPEGDRRSAQARASLRLAELPVQTAQ